MAVLVACDPSPPPRDTEPASTAVARPNVAAADTPPSSPAAAKIGEAADTTANAAPAEPTAAAPARELDPKLLDPRLANETAPERFTVTLETTRGELHLDVRRSWAPHGADRMYNLVRAGYFDDSAFFRVVEGFIAQVGISGDAAINRAWRSARIDDDPVAQSNLRGTLSFAAAGKNSRTTQVFINLADNAQLDAMGFAPIGRIRELEVAQQLNAKYGEGAPTGRGPMQARILREGNAYLKAGFPDLDYVKRATISEVKGAHPPRP